MSLLEPYFSEMRDKQTDIEAKLHAAGVDVMRVDWTYESGWTPKGVRLIARPRLKTDEEMIGRCSDPSCCA